MRNRSYRLLVLSLFISLGIILYSCATTAPGPNISEEQIPPDVHIEVRNEIKKLYSNSANVRGMAAFELGLKGDQSTPAIPFLIGMLGDGTEIQLKEEADEADKQLFTNPGQASALALGNIGEPAVEPLIEVLNSWNHLVRRNAIFALGKIKDHRAVEPLLEALQDVHNTVRIEAINALGEIRDYRAVEPIIGVIESGDKDLREAAKLSLRKITGANFSADSVDWAKWWEVKKVHFVNLDREEGSPGVPCPEDCKRMFEEGKLKAGMTIEECVRIVCGCADIQ
ncbi:HEAT repeat domain-containing protein [bacterium]|nr:MAG: HEAT repeat domain-containing protein [bacterium]